MRETVIVTFQYAIGEPVSHADDPGVAWVVVERFYREGISTLIRYRLKIRDGFEERMALESALDPL